MKERKESGQSVIEFLFLFPALIGLTIVLIKVSTAIQVSIVNQQYARAQALFLAWNSPFYPEARFQPGMISKRINQVVIGVSDNAAPSGGEEYTPRATVQAIARGRQVRGGEGKEANLRSNVRVRNTVTLCSPTYFVAGGSGGNGLVGMDLKRSPGQFQNLCGSQVQYE